MTVRTNAVQVAGDFDKLSVSAVARVGRAITLIGARLEAQVKRNASGRPGPKAPTGNYRRSISRRSMLTATSARAEVGTNMPHARRLEFGFSGADSLGRVYDTPAFPHFGPALDKIAPTVEAAIAAAITPGADA